MKRIAATTIALASGLAQATPINASLEQGIAFDTSTPRTGAPTLYICIELQGLESWDANGDSNNIVIEEFLGQGTVIVGASWEDVELTTNGNSFLNEATIGFNNEVALRVGAADNFGGTGTYTSDGIFDFMENNIDYTLGNDGMLSMEFFETQDDDADAVDAFYSAGKLYIYYIPIPAPGSLAILGVGGLVMTRRRRA